MKIDQKIQEAFDFVWPFLIFSSAIIIMMFWLWHYNATYVFSDTLLHFQRFYDTRMQIRTGNFSWFQTNYGFYHSARVFNALYGPLFAYFNGFLLLICRSWHNYELVVIFSTYFIASSGMYLLCQKAKLNKVLSVLLGIIYISFGIVPGIDKFNWMALGASLSPFVIMQGLNFVQDKNKPVHILPLAITMSLIAQIHVLSTLISTLYLIPFAIASFIKNKDKRKTFIFDLLKAIGLSLLLTANIWGSMLVVYLPNRISNPASYYLNWHAMHLFRPTNIHGQVPYVLSWLIILQCVYVIINIKNKHNNLNLLCTAISVCFMMISSGLVDWKGVQMTWPNLGRLLQFPYRLVLIAYPLMLLSIGLTLESVSHLKTLSMYQFGFGLLIIAIMQNTGLLMGLNQARTRNYLDKDKIALIGSSYWIKNRNKLWYTLRFTNGDDLFNQVSHVEPDYMPYHDGDKYHRASRKEYGKYIVDRYQNYHYIIHGSKLTFTWKGSGKNEVLPIVMYKQSRLTLNNKPAKILHYTHNCSPIVNTKKGLNSATVYFKVPFYFWILLIISLLSWICVIYKEVEIWLKRKHY